MIARAIRSTLSNIKSSKQVSFASIGSITIALSILGVFLFVYVNLNNFLVSWNKEVRLIIYLKDTVTKEQRQFLEKDIDKLQVIENWEFISRDNAWKNFKSMYSEKAGFLEELGFNPLPNSYSLQLKSGIERLERIRDLAERFNNWDGVESVEFGEKWISRFETFMIFMKVFLLGLGVLLGLGAVMIISNTIKLSVFSKKDEIELMLLIGATPRFIKFPYLMEGVIHGFLGAVLSLILVKGLHLFLQIQFQGSLSVVTRGMEFQFISKPYLILIFAISIFLGWFASYLTVSQFLSSYNKR